MASSNNGILIAAIAVAAYLWWTREPGTVPVIDDSGYPGTILTGHALHEAQVRALYQRLLARAPDTIGFNTYVGELDAGVKTAAQIEQNIRDSAEYRNLHLNDGGGSIDPGTAANTVIDYYTPVPQW